MPKLSWTPIPKFENIIRRSSIFSKPIDNFVTLHPVTRMTFQLADRSITRLFRVVEDVLVKVHQLTFLVDFVIMDIEEDAEIPLILGRPFMVTTKCVVDMGKGNLEMSVEDQKAAFNLFEGIKHPSDSNTCFKVEEIEQKANPIGGHQNSVVLE